MRRMYSQHAPFENFWQQSHITPKEEFDINWNGEAEKVNTKEEILQSLDRGPGRHQELLQQFYLQSDSILSLGAGNGMNEVKFLIEHPNKNIILSDTSIGFLKKLSEQFNVNIREIDSRNIEFPDNSFDFVYALAAEYFFNNKDFTQMLSEMARVTKPGKHFLISTVAIDIQKIDLIRKIYYNLTRYIPPSLWIILNKFILRKKIKLTGYARTLKDFYKTFQKIQNRALIKAIYFDYDQSRQVKSAAFLFTKNSL